MPYIYKIKNKLNNKLYIGKTLKTVPERWKEHCNDYKKDRCSNRPLYRAMKKHGIENFEIEIVEECDESVLSERECYWIEFFGSFKQGYNATIGGDGKQYVDYDVVLSTYRNLKNQLETAKALGISQDTVKKILDIRKEDIVPTSEINQKAVEMFDFNGKFIKSFSSITDASQYLIDNGQAGKVPTIRKHISEVCRGIRNTAYKHRWCYAKN